MIFQILGPTFVTLNVRKFQNQLIIFWNPQKSFFDPKIHIFDPRTPKFGILVQNGVFIHKFLEFLESPLKWMFSIHITD